MRSFLFRLLSVVSAMAMCIGFWGCKDDEEEKDNGGNGGGGSVTKNEESVVGIWLRIDEDYFINPKRSLGGV